MPETGASTCTPETGAKAGGGLSVTKRSGEKEAVSFDKILARLQCLGAGLAVDPASVALKTIRALAPDIKTSELDDLAAEAAAGLTWNHPDYRCLAGRVAVSNLIKSTPGSFSGAMLAAKPVLCPKFVTYVQDNAAWLDAAVEADAAEDYRFNYLAIATLKRSYLLRTADEGAVLERPSYLYMRVAVALYYPDAERIRECFHGLVTGKFTHATPTLGNAGRTRQQLASCFLLPVSSDSISGIFKTLSDCAQISKWGGGIGIDFTPLRTHGSPISGTGGTSNGLRYVLKTFNEAARYVDQGGGKRKGAWCAYLEIWHRCVLDFLDMRLPQGSDASRARDLFYALWIPDIFMERVEADGPWLLLCPTEGPGLHDCFGAAFRKRYLELEASPPRSSKALPAREIWKRILTAQRETGMPFMLYKDAANAKSNQQHLGAICCSNLCTEILQYSSPEETAVCNLASLALPVFVREGPDVETLEGARARFNFEGLARETRLLVRNLNAAIDRTFYPVAEGATSNLRHRPIGIGVQGLADVFLMMHLPYTHPISRAINRDIFEQIYYSALEESNALAKERGSYESFAGSPASKGLLQMDLWEAHGHAPDPSLAPSMPLDWKGLRERIAAHGLRNSLLTAPMPTASTAQILGNSEMTEPHVSHVFLKKTLSGEFVECNPLLIKRLEKLSLWTPQLRERLLRDRGSVQAMSEIPAKVREVFQTVWEMGQKAVIQMAADRGRFVDQSQSLNLHCDDESKMSSMHFHVWKLGLKGSYYRRSRPAAHPLVPPAERGCESCSA